MTGTQAKRGMCSIERARLRSLIVLAARARPGITRTELAMLAGVDRNTIGRNVRAIQDEGLVVESIVVDHRGANMCLYPRPPPDPTAAERLARFLSRKRPTRAAHAPADIKNNAPTRARPSGLFAITTPDEVPHVPPKSNPRTALPLTMNQPTQGWD